MSEGVTSSAERELGQALDNIEHTESFSAAGLEIVKVFFQPGTYIDTTLTTHMARFFRKRGYISVPKFAITSSELHEN